MRPLLLDLFCGAGGAAVGYHRAGFDILGIDVVDQPHYPFDFVKADALEWLDDGVPLVVEAIHASPPCLRYTTLAKGNNNNEADYADLIPATRTLLQATGLPYVIENVPSAPLRCPIVLCGEMFGLNVIRHRLFESNFLMLQPPHPRHRGRVTSYRHGTLFTGPYFAVYGTGGERGTLDEWRTAMDMPWAQDKYEIAQAIPPTYTRFVGAQLLEAVRSAA